MSDKSVGGKKLKKACFLGREFCTVLVCFLCVVIFVLSFTAGQYERMQDADIALFSTLSLAGILFLFFLFFYRGYRNMGEAAGYVIFAVIVLLQILFLVYVSHPMIMGDPARVHHEALSMLHLHHGQMDASNTYLQNYPNNHFITVFFYYFYGLLNYFGITDIWIPAIVLNACCIDTGIFLSYAFIRKVKDAQAANVVLVFFLFCPAAVRLLSSLPSLPRRTAFRLSFERSVYSLYKGTSSYRFFPLPDKAAA